jgi:formylglycine-generating enzyme required for sulfatase activity
MAGLRVFLCHASEDKERVRELSARLTKDGFETWLDEERILPGQDWDFEIRQAVRNSDVVVVCISGRSAGKIGYVQKELRTVLDLADHQPEGRVFIIPVRLELCEVPSRLTQWQYADLFAEHGYEQLLTALRAGRAERPGAPAAQPAEARRPKRHRRISRNWIAAAIGGGALTAGVYAYFGLRGSPAPPLPGPEIQKAAHSEGMVLIPGGRFLMGRSGGPDPEAEPAHEIQLAPYLLDERPVTNRQFREFLQQTNPEAAKALADDETPVTNVTWDEAYAYCLAQGNRLPTEAEWEYAARGTDGRLYPWGESFDPAAVNYGKSGILHTEPVGARPRNRSPFGVLDMAGNVWQWCSDDYRHYAGHKSELPIPRGAKVIRGGSFRSESSKVTSVARDFQQPSQRSSTIGFRCAR